MSKEKVFTDSNFKTEVLESGTPVLVDFWAEWCGPCRMLAPVVERIAKANDGKIIVGKLNVDENQETPQQYGIQGIPTMLFVSGGKIVHRQVGALPERMLRDVVTQFMEVVSQS